MIRRPTKTAMLLGAIICIAAPCGAALARFATTGQKVQSPEWFFKTLFLAVATASVGYLAGEIRRNNPGLAMLFWLFVFCMAIATGLSILGGTSVGPLMLPLFIMFQVASDPMISGRRE